MPEWLGSGSDLDSAFIYTEKEKKNIRKELIASNF